MKFSTDKEKINKKEIIEFEKPTLMLPKCRLSENKMGLEFDDHITHGELISIGKMLKTFEGAVQFWIGDWINANWGKYEHGKYEEAEKLGYEKKTLENYASTSRSIECSLRREDLTHSHHELVTKFTPEQQKGWLQKTVENEWSYRELSSAIREESKSETPELPAGKFGIIYADPPWKFETWSEKGKGRSAEQHYPTMPLEDIKNLSVNELAYENCALFLWAVSPMLPQALEVMESWGFIYKTVAFTWIKEDTKGDIFKGLGFWTRSNAEFCLLGTRGMPKRNSSDVSQIIISKREEHSKKPDEIRDRIVELMGDLPRIELFARNERKGWVSWGNENYFKRWK